MPAVWNECDAKSPGRCADCRQTFTLPQRVVWNALTRQRLCVACFRQRFPNEQLLRDFAARHR